MTFRTVWLAAAIASALGGSGARASLVTITTADGTWGADSFVQLGAATSNFGTSAEVTVKYGGNDTSTTTRKGYLRFDLAPLSQLAQDATLRLTVSANNGGGTPQNTNPQNFTLNIYGLNDGSTAGGGFLGEDWGETAINWNNAPANIISGTGAGNAVRTGTSTTNGGEAVLLGSFAVTQNDPVGTTIVALTGQPLVDFLNADTNGHVTFILTRTGWSSGGGSPTPSQGSSNLSFASGEHGTLAKPTLEITPVPEPSAWMLAAAGLAIALLVGRRRVVR